MRIPKRFALLVAGFIVVGGMLTLAGLAFAVTGFWPMGQDTRFAEFIAPSKAEKAVD